MAVIVAVFRVSGVEPTLTDPYELLGNLMIEEDQDPPAVVLQRAEWVTHDRDIDDVLDSEEDE